MGIKKVTNTLFEVAKNKLLVTKYIRFVSFFRGLCQSIDLHKKSLYYGGTL